MTQTADGGDGVGISDARPAAENYGADRKIVHRLVPSGLEIDPNGALAADGKFIGQDGGGLPDRGSGIEVAELRLDQRLLHGMHERQQRVAA